MDRETFADLMFPVHGIDISTPTSEQRQGTTRQGTNVRLYEAKTRRSRGGLRPGLGRFVDDQLPLGYQGNARPIQCLDTVTHFTSDVILEGCSPTEQNFESLVTDPSGPGLAYLPSTEFPEDPLDPMHVRSRQLGQGWSSTEQVIAVYKARGGGLVCPKGGGNAASKGSRRSVGINWSSPFVLNGTFTLSSIQLNAYVYETDTGDVVPGTFTYTPPAGTVVSPFNVVHVLAHFVPNNTRRYPTFDTYKKFIIVHSGGSDPGTEDGDPPACILLRATLPDLGFNCYAVCPPDDMDSMSPLGISWQCGMDCGLWVHQGEIDADASGPVVCP